MFYLPERGEKKNIAIFICFGGSGGFVPVFLSLVHAHKLQTATGRGVRSKGKDCVTSAQAFTRPRSHASKLQRKRIAVVTLSLKVCGACLESSNNTSMFFFFFYHFKKTFLNVPKLSGYSSFNPGTILSWVLSNSARREYPWVNKFDRYIVLLYETCSRFRF